LSDLHALLAKQTKGVAWPQTNKKFETKQRVLAATIGWNAVAFNFKVTKGID
jgi:hypothetical protein